MELPSWVSQSSIPSTIVDFDCRVLNKTGTQYTSVEDFVTPFTKASTPDPSGSIDLENPLPSPTSQLPAPLAIEFLADIELEKAGSTDDAVAKAQAIGLATQVCHTRLVAARASTQRPSPTAIQFTCDYTRYDSKKVRSQEIHPLLLFSDRHLLRFRYWEYRQNRAEGISRLGLQPQAV